ncbi:unnamed protein product, partial [Prorocentrum cordatum]
VRDADRRQGARAGQKRTDGRQKDPPADGRPHGEVRAGAQQTGPLHRRGRQGLHREERDHGPHRRLREGRDHPRRGRGAAGQLVLVRGAAALHLAAGLRGGRQRRRRRARAGPARGGYGR